MPEFRPGDRVFIDGDRDMMGTVIAVERVAGTPRGVRLVTTVHVQFDHLSGDPSRPGLKLPVEPKYLSLDIPESLSIKDIEQWLVAP